MRHLNINQRIINAEFKVLMPDDTTKHLVAKSNKEFNSIVEELGFEKPSLLNIFINFETDGTTGRPLDIPMGYNTMQIKWHVPGNKYLEAETVFRNNQANNEEYNKLLHNKMVMMPGYGNPLKMERMLLLY